MSTRRKCIILLSLIGFIAGCSDSANHALSGQVSVEGQAVTAKSPPGVYIVLHPIDADGEAVSAPLGEGGRFRFTSIREGNCRVAISDFPGFRDRKTLLTKYSKGELGPEIQVPSPSP